MKYFEILEDSSVKKEWEEAHGVYWLYVAFEENVHQRYGGAEY